MASLKNNKILNTVESKRIIPRYTNLTLALFISAIAFNLFLNQYRIVAGGTGGVATILDSMYGFDPSLVIFILSAVLTILSIIFLDWDYSLSMIYIAIVYPIFVEFTSPVTEIIKLNTNDLFLISIFGGIISGITSGIIYRNGLSSGGFSVIGQILNKYKKVSMTKVNLIINGSIVLFGGYIIGYEMVLYAIIYLYISKIITDRIMIGVSKSKTFYIVSAKYEKLKEEIIEHLGHSVTQYDVKGGNNLEKKEALMTVIPTKEYYHFKEIIDKIDKKAFVVVVDSYEVKGGK